MRKPTIGALAAFLLLASLQSDAHGSWLIYHKPAYEGKVVDVETNEPIEGAERVNDFETPPVRI